MSDSDMVIDNRIGPNFGKPLMHRECSVTIQALRARIERLEQGLRIVERCASERYDEMGGDCPTYELAFSAAEIGAGTLSFLRDHARTILDEQG